MQVVPINKDGYNLMHRGMIAFSEMQRNGIRINEAYCKQAYKDITKEIKEQEEKVFSYKEIKEWKKIYRSDFNLDSGDQLRDVLFNRFKYKPIGRTESGLPSVDKKTLEAMRLSFTDDLLRYRMLQKMKNTYLRNLIRETHNGYLHPFINLHIPRTFRSATQAPNTQNMPIRDPEAGAIVRQAFIPRDNHYLIECDYGGIEVKASQWYHKDPTMQSYLDNPLTADMHADFMQLLFMIKKYDAKCKGEKTLRKGTKNGFTFPQFYGDYYGNNAPILWYWAQLHGKKINPKHGLEISSGKTIGQHLIDNGVKNFKQFEKHVQKIERNMWDVRFPVYKKWKEDQYQWYLKHGYLTSLSGFTFQGIMGKNDAVNYPIQAVAFHCLLWSVIRLTKLIKKYKMKTKLIFQVHDSVVADVPKKERDDYLELLKQVMCHEVREHWKWIITPLELEADCSELNGNWSRMKTIMEYIH